MNHNPKFSNPHGPIAAAARAGHASINALRLAWDPKTAVKSYDDISNGRSESYERSVRKLIGEPKMTEAQIHEDWVESARSSSVPELRNHKNLCDYDSLDPQDKLKVTVFKRAVLDVISVLL